MSAAGGERSGALFARAALVVLPTRLAFLAAGYGTDSDAWRIAVTGRAIAERHAYQASRLPGYPIFELAAALLWRGGPLALNGATALMSACAAGGFALALRRLGARGTGGAPRAPEALAGALALAMTPAIYIHSVDAMDYVWALAFAMAALWLVLEARPLAAGVALGLAIGCRITSGALLVPLLVLLGAVPGERGGGRGGVKLTLAALGAGGLAFAPVALTYGLRFLGFYEHGPTPPLYVLKGPTVDLWGIPGLLAVTLAAVLGGWRWASGRARPAGRVMAACAAAVGLYGIAYLRLPHDAAYLIPAVPFVLVAFHQLLDRRAFLLLCALLLVSPFVVKLSEPGKADSPPPSAAARELRLGGRPLLIDALQGPILWDHARRLAGVRYRDRVLSRARALRGPSVVVAHEWLPWIREALTPADTTRLKFVYLLDRERAVAYRRQGYALYYLRDALGENRDRLGLDLRELGAGLLAAGEGPPADTADGSRLPRAARGARPGHPPARGA